MSYYVSLIGDQSPERSRILLPIGITVQTIYEKYLEFHPGTSAIKRSHFFAIWRKNFSHVSHQKVDVYIFLYTVF